MLDGLLKLSRAIDAVNIAHRQVGRVAGRRCDLISATNATIRKVFD
jgi:hypothetical protein